MGMGASNEKEQIFCGMDYFNPRLHLSQMLFGLYPLWKQKT